MKTPDAAQTPTPRTDAHTNIEVHHGLNNKWETETVSSAFARELERELTDLSANLAAAEARERSWKHDCEKLEAARVAAIRKCYDHSISEGNATKQRITDAAKWNPRAPEHYALVQEGIMKAHFETADAIRAAFPDETKENDDAS